MSVSEWGARLAALQRRAAAVLALERAMVEYQAAGGGFPLPVVCAGCSEYPDKAVRKVGRGKKAA